MYITGIFTASTCYVQHQAHGIGFLCGAVGCARMWVLDRQVSCCKINSYDFLLRLALLLYAQFDESVNA